jgi:hypothetical protein
MSLSISLNRYRAEVTKANDFINNAHKVNQNGYFIVPKIERDFITSASFLVFFMAWEKFLEESTIKFMRGRKTISGNSIIRYVKPTSDDHAHLLLRGTNKYVDWSNPNIVKRLANLVFAAGNPINSVLSSVESDVSDLKTIRNAAAHLSSTTSRQLDALATRKLRTPCININVAELILHADPDAVLPDVTLFDSYKTLLDAAAYEIAR